jgi:3D (Asp-Asp-Asp) domain-containing protein
LKNFIKTIVLSCACFGMFGSMAHHTNANPTIHNNDIKVQINDSLVHFPDAQPFLDDASRLQVPIRILTDELGYDISWMKLEDNSTDYKVSISNSSKTIDFITGHTTAHVDGKAATLDTAPQYMDGRVYVPMRFVSESLGIRVQWDEKNRIAIMNEDGSYHAPAWYAPKVARTIEAKATAYTAAVNENSAAGAVDYFGNPLEVGTISVDPNVIPLGSTVYIEGYSYEGLPEDGMFAKATDIGGSVKGSKIDIFVPDNANEARKFGIQSVKIHVLEP